MCDVVAVVAGVCRVGLQLSKEWLQHQWVVAVCQERLWFDSGRCLRGYSEDYQHSRSTAGYCMWSDFFLYTLLCAGRLDQAGCEQVDIGCGSMMKPVVQYGLM